MTDHKRIDILVVQDDPAEVLFLRETLLHHRIVNRVDVVPDSRQAVAYLCADPPYTGVPSPDVLLLDLQLPGYDGRYVLRRLRERDATAGLPVIVMVDSPAAEDIVRRERLPVQGYVTKPLDLDALTVVVRAVGDFGFEILRSTSRE